MSKASDIRIREISHSTEDFTYRTPIKFGGVALDRATVLNVECIVETNDGKVAKGFGSMPMSNVWAWPTRNMQYAQTLDGMLKLAERICAITGDYSGSAHPIDINHALEKEYLKAADEISKQQEYPDPIPVLCTLVVASPFDAAIHDAFGKAHGLNCYHTYGSDFMTHDLSHYLGDDFKGEYVDQYVLKTPQPRMPLYHLIGALDPLTDADIDKRLDDGMPETLPEWIRHNGLTHLKVKLNGDNIDWDVNRLVSVERVASETQKELGVQTWYYSTDFNERCANVEYLLEFLHRVKEESPSGFERVQYIEQPTSRDLKGTRDNVMHEASKLRPVVIDEALIDQESLLIAQEMGYTGAALKACKGQSSSLLMAAAAQKMKMFLCVQDLTCPGASLIHSAGLAAHVPGVAAIEANSRQYCPIANEGWDEKFPGIFRVTDGMMDTSVLNGPGLGAVLEMITGAE